jgi:polyphosphate glucokinase
MNILVIDVGGTHVKLLASGQTEPRRFDSGLTMTAEAMVASVLELTHDWKYDVVSIGYPGPVRDDKPSAEPHNLAPGWVGFDFEKALARPVKMINDAAMQALGSYHGGRMLFLGLGTGLGSTLIVDSVVAPLELAHLPYKKGRTYEDYVGARGLQRLGKKKWRAAVDDVCTLLVAAMQADDLVLGGGEARQLKELPARARLGDNANAFVGGYRMWQATDGRGPSARAWRRPAKAVAPGKAARVARVPKAQKRREKPR